jgi:hypothetical protein
VQGGSRLSLPATTRGEGVVSIGLATFLGGDIRRGNHTVDDLCLTAVGAGALLAVEIAVIGQLLADLRDLLRRRARPRR